MARILLIEDDPAALYAMRRSLEQDGHEVIESSDAEAALALQREQPADVIVTDVFLPGTSGLQVLEAVRQEHPWVPVIVCTGGGTKNGRHVLASAAYLGAANVLAKPFDMADLRQAVAELVRPV